MNLWYLSEKYQNNISTNNEKRANSQPTLNVWQFYLFSFPLKYFQQVL